MSDYFENEDLCSCCISDYFENEVELDNLSFVGLHLVVDKDCFL